MPTLRARRRTPRPGLNSLHSCGLAPEEVAELLRKGFSLRRYGSRCTAATALVRRRSPGALRTRPQNTSASTLLRGVDATSRFWRLPPPPPPPPPPGKNPA